MATSVVDKKKYTYEDYLNISDDKRYELIEGELLMAPSPFTRHQRISRKIGALLDEYVTENGLGEIFYAPCDVYFDDGNVVQPDILYITKERSNIITEKNIQGAPDIAIEIVSESSAYRDMVQKKALYLKFGVSEYWIVIPESEIIEIHILKGNVLQLYKTYEKGDSLESPCLKGLKIQLREIF